MSSVSYECHRCVGGTSGCGHHNALSKRVVQVGPCQLRVVVFDPPLLFPPRQAQGPGFVAFLFVLR